MLHAKGNKLAVVDEAKRLRLVAALKVDRLVVGAVDMHDLAWIEAYSNPRRCGHAGVSVRFVIDHGVNDELRSHYRRLVLENHPDKLMARGVPKEFVAIATEKVSAINEAYGQIAKERGI